MADGIVMRWGWRVGPFLLAAVMAGCYAGVFAHTYQVGGTEAALGEEHEMDYPAHDAFLLTQDALRGQGILFDVKPDDSLVTYWQKPDQPGGILSGLVGAEPGYRYEIQVVPEGAVKSKVVVNLRVRDIPDSDLDQYRASTRLDLFHKIDEVAKLTPPPSNLPRTGGVNFTLLPHEDLAALAKRVTGSADNWREIAKDNGISSPSDVTPFETIWVRNSLLKGAPIRPPTSDASEK
jgi:hypothetical protein